MEQWWDNSFLFGGNSAYLETLYDAYLQDPNSIDDNWRNYFDKIHQEAPGEVSHEAIKAAFKNLVKYPQATSEPAPFSSKQYQIYRFINAYRSYGHHAASLDPLNHLPPKNKEKLQLNYYGLTDDDLNNEFDAGNFANLGKTTLKNIADKLHQTYSYHIGFEYMHISDAKQHDWLQSRIEEKNFYQSYSKEERLQILSDLIAADRFENFLGKKYVGQKRFGLEGGDSLIVQLNHITKTAGANPIEEFVIGMPHRGRLSVLANIIGKPIKEILHEFDGMTDDELKAAMKDPKNQTYMGDVKYHLGYSMDRKTAHGVTHMSLAFNPSHLEFVGPVAEGSVRARQRRRGENGINQVLPILLHGDAAFAGQGVVMETLNMSQTPGFFTGGTIHIIVNNQVGFTTSNPKDARSTEYCSDIGKMMEIPIFHVNGDDPEAVVFVTQLAYDYRMTFHRDVIIDLVCYRRHGHQEVDEPSATQPLMYQIIKKHPTTAKLYADQLIGNHVTTQTEVDNMIKAYEDKLLTGNSIPEVATNSKNPLIVDWTPYLGQDLRQIVDTTFPKNELIELGKKLDHLPDDMTLQPQVNKMMEDRKKMTAGEMPLNWGYAEVLAYATLLSKGTCIRLSGEDCQRGTFAHRHAVLHDYKNGKTYIPLDHLSKDQGSIKIINSLLSELGVLGFEYGIACSDPKNLVIWEAQFGDFANGAQVIIDQFISSAEQKWDRLCGLVMLLPHGYEGMGPEHSSARLERYLQLCAQGNMQVCVPTTPAQIFHLLRRQVIRPCRKPLITLSPKSLLRHHLAVSSLEDLANGEFQLVLREADDLKAEKVKRVILCSGKVYYDLLEKRREQNIQDIAMIRIEQLYPFPLEELQALLKQYKNAKEIIWCQEEPKNQGAWYSLHHKFVACVNDKQTLSFVGRDASSSPAVGHAKLHKLQQQLLVEEALLIKSKKG